MSQKKINGKQVYVQELRESFFDDYISAFSSKVRKLLHVKWVSSEIEYLRVRIEKQKKGQTVFFCIFDKQSDLLIGAIEIRDSSETSSQLYSWIHEDFWGTGMYQEALNLASKEYFSRTNKKFFFANVDASNKRSYYALKKQGFLDIGTRSGPHGRQYQLVLRKK